MSKASPAFDKRDFDAILSRTWSAMRHEIGAEEAKGGRQARRYRLSLRVSAGPEGGFTVTCPKLPPVATYGETLEEAQANAREAIELCLEVMREDGQPIPPPDRDLASPIEQLVSVAAAAEV
jgi:predicted RNase H-like HicB family nuclease